jgi:hypothetical protein
MASMAAMTRRLSQIERHVLMVLMANDIQRDSVALSRVHHNKESAVRIYRRALPRRPFACVGNRE